MFRFLFAYHFQFYLSLSSMIKERGVLIVQDGHVYSQWLRNSLNKLPDGDYEYWVIGQGKFPPLPQLKYLNGVVLKTISERLPGNPPIGALYRYFEQLYAPVHICEIQGVQFTYRDLKSEKSNEMDNVIEHIVRHAAAVWGIQIQSRSEVSASEDKEPYMDAYNEMWKNLPNFKK